MENSLATTNVSVAFFGDNVKPDKGNNDEGCSDKNPGNFQSKQLYRLADFVVVTATQL